MLKLFRKPGAHRGAAFCLLLCVTTGCFGNRPIPDVDKVIKLPKEYAKAPGIQAPVMQKWCADFGDPKLKSLIDQAFESNLDVRVAWNRLAQSRVIGVQVDSGLYPTVDVSAQVSQQRAGIITPTGIVNIDVRQYRPTVAAAYEVDLWGRLAAQREAARLDFDASRADVDAVIMSVTSEVASAWFDVLQQRQKSMVLVQQKEVARKYIELLMVQLRYGSGNALDVTQQQQQIQALEAQKVTVDALLAQSKVRLAALLGVSVQELALPDPTTSKALPDENLPQSPPIPAVGIPADLLERRPDVRAAHIRLLASNKRIAVAVRNRLPSLQLSLNLFLQATTLAALVDTVLWNVAAQASAPLIDGGRRRADVRLAELRQDESLLNYASAVLTALNDVQLALIQVDLQDKSVELILAQQENAQTALDLVRDRYQQGADTYLRILTAQQSLQSLEQSVVDAKRAQLGSRVQLCRALGGSWIQAKEPKAQGTNQ